ncbi:diguanylate cyclase [Halarcobacter ebronensis]|uniref:diguanylate cyclase n=1 Tax=Halarcobacter ebronensis TaxID=1462615 RepID=A0A4Q0YJ78_9BACT|nr:transporter substrate-binding domain-containing protein [Halarcobacter ebronensis]RXJ69199.1 diguanylate cyclase [Halarcobacter ebronensis]
MKKIAFLKILLLFFIPISLLSIDFTEEEKEFISNNKDIKVALMPDFSPFSFIEDNKIVGFEQDLLSLLSQKSGLNFVKNYGVWNKILYKFKTKQVDMIASISYKEEREPYTLYTKPYYEIPIMIFIRDDFGEYKNLDSLKGKKVGILKDVFYYKDLNDMNSMNLVVYETYEEITQALVFGKIDALIQNLPNINYLIKKNLYTNLKLAGELKLPDIKKEDLRFGIREDKPILHSIMQKSLNGIQKYEWDVLIDRWIDVKYNLGHKKYTTLTINESKYLKEKKDITMCIDPDLMPYEGFDKNGNYTGISADYYKLFEDMLSIKFTPIKTSSWSQTLQFAKEKKCDIVSLVMETPQRREYLNFTTPYLTIPLVLTTKLDKPFINNFKDLAGKKVGITKGYAYVELFKKEYPNINIIEVNNVKDGLEKVNKDELYAYLGTLVTVGYNLQQDYIGKLKISGTMSEDIKLGIGVRNDDPKLLNILQKSVNSITSEQHRGIINKWLSIKYEKKSDYSLFWKTLLIAIIFISFFAYWNRKISKTNRLLKEAKKEIEQKNMELQRLAITDKLTGIYNRARVDELLDSEIERSKRFNHPFGIIFFDIDYFKKVNDTFGHQVGDDVLVEITTKIGELIRKTDIVGRWGGEEFLIICPETQKEAVEIIAENIRKHIEEHKFPKVSNITISLGVSVYSADDTVTTIIKRVDDALYEAKKGGRNRVVFN